MDFLKKIFSSKSKDYKHLQAQTEINKTATMEDDERFVYYFIQKGGKFFYPDDMDDFKSELVKLLKYLQRDSYAVIERSYFHFLEKLKVPVKFSFTRDDVLLGGCESLIADEGAIMTTATHTKEYRNAELPHKRVVIALSNQIVSNKSQALISINKRYETPPANIQTMSVFTKPQNDLSGGKWYETYLFLIEN
jgi:hypothetical protein